MPIIKLARVRTKQQQNTYKPNTKQCSLQNSSNTNYNNYNNNNSIQFNLYLFGCQLNSQLQSEHEGKKGNKRTQSMKQGKIIIITITRNQRCYLEVIIIILINNRARGSVFC
jgi:hypothetical protein